ncbi:MAG: nucleoside hydrolase [Clostridia bacterium]|nr:nucleoside hydrolase [Clostridia bacterium]
MKETLLRIKNSAGLALRIIFSVALISLIIWKFRDLQNIDVRTILDGIASMPLKLATLLGIYAIKGLTLVVPASLIYVATGMALHPLWLAVVINCIGIVVEVSITYLMGIILGGPFVTKKLKKTKYGDRLITTYDKYEKFGIFLARFLFMPLDLCSLFFGSMRARFLPYLLLSLAGTLPRVILFTILGDKVYDLIPMKVIVPVAAALITVALIVWIVRYAVSNARNEANFGKSAYTPLAELKRNIILDTDIGADCDDAGAMAVMFEYLKKYDVRLLGICNCTSNAYGNGAIRAICNRYGIEDPVMGRYSGGDMLADTMKYNRDVTRKYFKYESSACGSMTDIEFYDKLLSESENDSVTIISIGTYSSISAALNHNPELFNKKVHSIVSMAGKFPSGKEFNIKSDPISARNVLDKFKKQIIFSGYEVGEDVKTGFDFEDNDNPVYDCYKMYLDKSELPIKTSSFDLTAVQYAFEGNGKFYSLSKPVKIEIDMDGTLKSKKDKFSNRYYIIRNGSAEELSAYLNELLTGRKPSLAVTEAESPAETV